VGEDLDLSSKLFEIPADRKVVIPDFEKVRYEDIPAIVIDQVDFDLRILEMVSKELVRLPVKLDFKEAGKAYLLAYDYDSSLDGSAKSRAIFEADVSLDGRAMGSGYSLIELDAVGREQVRPAVGHTFTEPDFTRQGLALRRLFILNEANKKWFGDALGSGTFVSSEGQDSPAKAMWEQLEAMGLAVKEDERFRFR
jgi:hypothetical protein